MRFHYGAIPEDPGFNPSGDGWQSLRFDPDPILLQLIAIPIAFLLFGIWAVFLTFILSVRDFSNLLIYSSEIPLGWTMLLILLILIPVHELLHAVVHPHWGRSSNTIVGLWLRKGVFYAHYEGVMSRTRFLLVTFAPYLLLGLLPLGLLAFLKIPVIAEILILVSLFGSLVACGDIVVMGLILLQIPGGALVRNNGWKTYWKLLQEN